MTQARFIQIHTLHSYPASLLNRDDAGLAKRLPFGDKLRTRISSQCLKRHWRTAEDRYALKSLNVPMAVRSRETLTLIRQKILDAGAPEAVAQAAVEALRDGGLLGKSGKERKSNGGKGKEVKAKDVLATNQAVMLGMAEINYLATRCYELTVGLDEEKSITEVISDFLKKEAENIRSLKHGSGLESALFGRMVTSDVLANRDAAVYVAHAFTVHEAQVENDYFTVVDDLLRETGESSSAGIFDTELASGVYYGYVVVDVPQLVSNLEGLSAAECFEVAPERRALAGEVVRHLLHLIATVSPGAKRGSTAPFGWAPFVLVEAGDWQPRSLAGAFQQAVPLTGSNLRHDAIHRLGDEVSKIDRAYGAPLERRYLSLDDLPFPGAERLSLASLAHWASACIQNGELPTMGE